MQENYSVLGERAFGADADSLTVIKYRSHHDALKYLQSALRGPNGIGLRYGPHGAGKTTIARELARRMGGDLSVGTAPGGGAAFRLTFAAPPCPAPTPRPARSPNGTSTATARPPARRRRRAGCSSARSSTGAVLRA